MTDSYTPPKTYEEWMNTFEYLQSNYVPDEFIQNIRQGTCLGIESVKVEFLTRLQDTVNNMLNYRTKICTRAISDALEEGDYSNAEFVLRRSYKEFQKCRFFQGVCFIPKDFVEELDEKIITEMLRYLKLLKEHLEEIADDSGNSDIEDLVYTLKRIISRNHKDGKL